MAQDHRHALILAGGRGTRFWPSSRTRTPKQLLPFLGKRSLLQETFDRLLPLVPAERIWILTNEHLREAIAQQLPGISARQILAEPEQRNTAPCLGLAAQIIARQDPEACLGVFPADHYIARPARFRKFANAAFAAAGKGMLVTLGIQPRWPETGYGYLEFPKGSVAGSLDAVKLRAFREKPDLGAAKRFFKSGNYYWNAGMFFWRASAFLEQLRSRLPKTFSLLASLPALDDASFASRLKKVYPKCDNISVDYAVMEKAAREGLVAALATDDIGWNDLGSWNAVYELLPADSAGNAVRGDALLLDSSGCYLEAKEKLIAVVGVKDLVIVDTPGALLIVDRKRAQDVGLLVKLLERQRRTELL